MTRAGRDRRRRRTATPTELEAECALVADAPFAQTFMTAASPGIVASAMDNRHYPSREEYVARGRRRAAHRVPLHRRARAAAADRRARPRDGAPHAVRRPTRSTSSSTGSTLVVDDINHALDGIDPTQRAAARVLGQLRGPAHPRRAARRDPRRSSTRRNVGALVISMANARHAHEYACFAREPLPDGMALDRGRDRHDEQLRRASRGRRRPARRASPTRSAIRTASSPAPTAASTRRPASATSRRRSCGRSCARCAPAPTSRPRACLS